MTIIRSETLERLTGRPAWRAEVVQEWPGAGYRWRIVPITPGPENERPLKMSGGSFYTGLHGDTPEAVAERALSDAADWYYDFTKRTETDR